MSRAQLTSTVEQNTGGAVSPYVAGKNKIINGDFGIWQRGTSFALSGSNTYTADRWIGLTPFGDSVTASQQTFTAGTAPVAGYEGTYFLRFTRASGTSGYFFTQKIEDVRTFAAQTVTVSFWAKASVGFTPTSIYLQQNFGSGGSAAVTASATGLSAITTSFVCYTYTIAVPSVSGKTIGSGNSLELIFNVNPGTASSTLDIWGVQVEAGSVATPFTTATGTLSGELAACQRYYWRNAQNTGRYANGYAKTTSTADVIIPFPVQMRTNPSALEQTGTATDYLLAYLNSATLCSAVPTFTNATLWSGTVNFTVASATLTAGNGLNAGPAAANAYLGWSAEL